jgi:hypothetical protein
MVHRERWGRHESSSAGRDRVDPPDHEGSAGRRIPIAHQKGLGIQALGQAAAEADAVKRRAVPNNGRPITHRRARVCQAAERRDGGAVPSFWRREDALREFLLADRSFARAPTASSS